MLQSRITREFGVGQERATEKELIGANGVGCEKIVRAGRADDVVLIDTVAADADRANEHAIAIERETSGKDRDSVRQIRVGHEQRIRHDRLWLARRA